VKTGLFSLFLLMCTGVCQAQFLNGPQCPVTPTMPPQAVIAEAFAKATDTGFLWRIEKNGKASHLYGSVHVGQFNTMFPGPKLFEAIKQAQTVALELNPMSNENQQYFAKVQREGVMPLPAPLKARLSEVATKLCVDSQLLEQVNQETIVAVLTLAGARMSGYFADWGTEMFLAGLASSTKKTIVELESAQSQSQMLKQTMGSEVDWQVLEQWLDDYASGKSQNQLLRMLKAWRSSDYAEFQNYLEWCECVKTEDDKRRWRLLNDDRNEQIALRIEQEHNKSSGPILAVVGSLHFTGPKALQVLLANAGFTVTRLVPQ
jgi:uncharacterized protein